MRLRAMHQTVALLHRADTLEIEQDENCLFWNGCDGKRALRPPPIVRRRARKSTSAHRFHSNTGNSASCGFV